MYIRKVFSEDSSPVLRQAQLSGQEGEDLGAVLLVLVGGVGDADGRHGQQHAGGARAADQHRQLGLHHHVHPLGGDKTTARRERVRLDGKGREGDLLTKNRLWVCVPEQSRAERRLGGGGLGCHEHLGAECSESNTIMDENTSSQVTHKVTAECLIWEVCLSSTAAPVPSEPNP